MAPPPNLAALEALAHQYDVAPAMALGQSAGLYFEYLRRPAPSPTHQIAGLNRELDTQAVARLARGAPGQAEIRAALRKNALWFNLDRAPTTALLGMEMLAEELGSYTAIADWQACAQDMAATIQRTRSLFRRLYADYLARAGEIEPFAAELCVEMAELAGEWDEFAACLDATAAASDGSSLERASRLLRRIAMREEHFWGRVMNATTPS